MLSPSRLRVSPAPTIPLDESIDVIEPSQVPHYAMVDSAAGSEASALEHFHSDAELSDDAESEFCSDESDAEAVIRDMATSQKPVYGIQAALCISIEDQSWRMPFQDLGREQHLYAVDPSPRSTPNSRTISSLTQ